MQAQPNLPNQEEKIFIERETFKKDQNFVVLAAEEIGDDDHEVSLHPGDQVSFYTKNGQNETWAGTGIITHAMECYILDIPPFVFQKHHDPSMKNPIALVNSMQSRLGRRMNAIDLVVCLGFRIIGQND